MANATNTGVAVAFSLPVFAVAGPSVTGGLALPSSVTQPPPAHGTKEDIELFGDEPEDEPEENPGNTLVAEPEATSATSGSLDPCVSSNQDFLEPSLTSAPTPKERDRIDISCASGTDLETVNHISAPLTTVEQHHQFPDSFSEAVNLDQYQQIPHFSSGAVHPPHQSVYQCQQTSGFVQGQNAPADYPGYAQYSYPGVVQKPHPVPEAGPSHTPAVFNFSLPPPSSYPAAEPPLPAEPPASQSSLVQRTSSTGRAARTTRPYHFSRRSVKISEVSEEACIQSTFVADGMMELSRQPACPTGRPKSKRYKKLEEDKEKGKQVEVIDWTTLEVEYPMTRKPAECMVRLCLKPTCSAVGLSQLWLCSVHREAHLKALNNPGIQAFVYQENQILQAAIYACSGLGSNASQMRGGQRKVPFPVELIRLENCLDVLRHFSPAFLKLAGNGFIETEDGKKYFSVMTVKLDSSLFPPDKLAALRGLLVPEAERPAAPYYRTAPPKEITRQIESWHQLVRSGGGHLQTGFAVLGRNQPNYAAEPYQPREVLQPQAGFPNSSEPHHTGKPYQPLPHLQPAFPLSEESQLYYAGGPYQSSEVSYPEAGFPASGPNEPSYGAGSYQPIQVIHPQTGLTTSGASRAYYVSQPDLPNAGFQASGAAQHYYTGGQVSYPNPAYGVPPPNSAPVLYNSGIVS